MFLILTQCEALEKYSNYQLSFFLDCLTETQFSLCQITEALELWSHFGNYAIEDRAVRLQFSDIIALSLLVLRQFLICCLGQADYAHRMSNVVCGRKSNLPCVLFQERGGIIILFDWQSKVEKVLVLLNVSKRFNGTQPFDVVTEKIFALQMSADLVLWI